jgi:hypothetical protein
MSTPMSITWKFLEKDRNRTETDRVSVYFGSNRNNKIVSSPCPFPRPSPCPCPYLCPCPRPCPCPSTPMSIHKSVLIFRFGLFRNADFLYRFITKRFRNTETNREIIFLGFTEKTETEPKQIEFRFVSVRTETKNCLFQGHLVVIYAPKQNIL